MTKRRPRAVLLFEASANVGGGHAARCLALASELAKTHDLTLAANTSAASLLSRAPPHAHLDWPDGAAAGAIDAVTHVARPVFDLAVVDHYRLDALDERKLYARASCILAIDDLANRRHDCDIVLDATPGTGPERYLDLVPPSCRVLAGSDYALLRPEFRQARLAAREAVAPDLKRILVSMGATDPGDVTSKVLRALVPLGNTIQVTVVLSHLAPHLIAVSELVTKLCFSARLVCDAPSMSELYAAHDICIGAPATSALERCCVGLPSLLIETAENQRHLASALAAAAACRVLGPHVDVGPETICAETIALLSDAVARERLRRSGLRMVDGLGSPRTAANLATDFATANGELLVGRRLRRADADLLMAWNTEPGTRSYSRSAHVPTRAEHTAWIAQRLDSSSAVTEIIEACGTPVAVARLDPKDDALEVSIVVAPGRRGEGIGQAAIRYLDKLAGETPCVAWVHPANAASRALFMGCGYRIEPGAPRRLRYLDV